VSTNTFGCAPYVLAEYGLAERAHELSLPPRGWRATPPATASSSGHGPVHALEHGHAAT